MECLLQKCQSWKRLFHREYCWRCWGLYQGKVSQLGFRIDSTGDSTKVWSSPQPGPSRNLILEHRASGSESSTDSQSLKIWCLELGRSWMRSNQSTPKEINPEYPSLKLWRASSLEKILMLGKIEGKRRRWWQRMRWLDRITDSVNINLSKLWEIMKNRGT